MHSSLIDECPAAPCSPGLPIPTGGSNQPFWVAGAGIEYAFNNNWSVKEKFLSWAFTAAAASGSTFCGNHNTEGIRTFKVGLNYHFNSPIVSKRTYAHRSACGPAMYRRAAQS